MPQNQCFTCKLLTSIIYKINKSDFLNLNSTIFFFWQRQEVAISTVSSVDKTWIVLFIQLNERIQTHLLLKKKFLRNWKWVILLMLRSFFPKCLPYVIFHQHHLFTSAQLSHSPRNYWDWRITSKKFPLSLFIWLCMKNCFIQMFYELFRSGKTLGSKLRNR